VRVPLQKEVTGKIGVADRDLYRSVGSLGGLKTGVSDKIGVLEKREHLVKRPELKVGSSSSNNFVDTYSIS